jgi:hypothetical protein
MKRFLASAFIIGVSTFGVVGCDQTTKTEDTTKTTGPGGSDTKKIIVEEKKSGDAKDPAPVTPPVEAPK